MLFVIIRFHVLCPTQAAREVAAPKRSSLFWSDDKATEKDESLDDSYEKSTANIDDDNDETVPNWFRLLDQQSTEPDSEERDTSNNQEVDYYFSSFCCPMFVCLFPRLHVVSLAGKKRERE